MTTAYIALQLSIGAGLLGTWALVSNVTADDDLLGSAVRTLPYFACYLFGVASRYIPGVKSTAKRLAK